ncbi:SIMPL domain-containing protein [Acetobacter conturbans]|uniref:DUF541 domain-containing protein n=1 Tax=Acetobacter conturbans TaxID=1737472 RepID=A0ABX0K675_9PROT|nr:SIMPL domain-containing protein [Acetobacter conturbans]NHN88914.1 DUF541 domain-containing protein [Acetobacter conturbans]
MIRRKSLFATATTFCLAAILAGPALAAGQDTEAGTTRLTISGSGSVDAAPDMTTATLLAQNEAAKAVDAQARTNTLAHQTITTAEKIAGISVQSESYQVSENRSDNKAPSWTARQTIQVKAKDAGALLELVGKLQANGLLLEGVEWSLSPEHQKQLQRQAEQSAVKDMKDRADAIASDLGMKVASIATLSVNEPMLMRPMAMMARVAIAAPTMRPDDQTVSATVQATVLLKN